MDSKEFKGLMEAYEQVHAPQEVEYVDEDSRRMSNKQHTKRVRSNIKSFGSDYTPPSNYDPDANRGQGEVLTRKQIEKKRRKALRQEEVENVDEAMRPGPRREKMRAKMHDPYVRGGSKSRGQAHNIAVRGDVSTGDPAIKSRGGGGVKKDKGMGYGDRGAGNKARRRAGQEPLRGNTRREELEATGLFTVEEIERIIEIMCD